MDLSFKRNKLYAIILLVSLVSSGCAKEEPLPEVTVNGKGALIVDAVTYDVLFQKNPDGKFPPASTTKVMTAILAIENLPLDYDVVPTKNVASVEPTVIGLRPGVKYKLSDLIKAIIIKSANDAAFVIAEAVAGSEKEFARMMNEKARRIGMESTYFATASGLPTGKKDSQYTTARDLAIMMCYAMQYDVILEAMSKPTAEIEGSNGRRIYLKTHNKALLRDPETAPWGKTGYTREARRTFAGCDPSMEPKIAFGLLKSTDLWRDITTLKDKGLEIHQIKSRTWWDRFRGE